MNMCKIRCPTKSSYASGQLPFRRLPILCNIAPLLLDHQTRICWSESASPLIYTTFTKISEAFLELSPRPGVWKVNGNTSGTKAIQLSSHCAAKKRSGHFNKFRTDTGKFRSNLTGWGIINYAMCDCGVPIKTMKYIFNECFLKK